MKKIYIVWALIIVVMLSLVLYFGFNFSNKNKEYKELEEEILVNAEKYLGANLNEYPTTGSNKVLISKIINYGIDIDLSVNDDMCDGYILITREQMGYDTKVFVKCNNYTTDGYEE